VFTIITHSLFRARILPQNNACTIHHPSALVNHFQLSMYRFQLLSGSYNQIPAEIHHLLHKKGAAKRSSLLIQFILRRSTNSAITFSSSVVISSRFSSAAKRPTISGLCRWLKIVSAKYSSRVSVGTNVRP